MNNLFNYLLNILHMQKERYMIFFIEFDQYKKLVTPQIKKANILKNIFTIAKYFGTMPNDPKILNLTMNQIAFIVEVINNI